MRSTQQKTRSANQGASGGEFGERRQPQSGRRWVMKGEAEASKLGDQTQKKKVKTYGLPELPLSAVLVGEATFLDAETNNVEVWVTISLLLDVVVKAAVVEAAGVVVVAVGEEGEIELEEAETEEVEVVVEWVVDAVVVAMVVAVAVVGVILGLESGGLEKMTYITIKQRTETGEVPPL